MILNEFVALTGYNRCYASYVLRNWEGRIVLKVRGETVEVILGKPSQRARRQRRRNLMGAPISVSALVSVSLV